MNTNNTLFTNLLIESIMEENNIDEGKIKDYIRRRIGPYVAGLATVAAINNPQIIKKPLSYFDKLKTTVSAKKNLPSYVSDQNEILMRQAYKESAFNPKAKSKRGAMGLGQQMPSAIEDYLKRNPGEEIDPYNPEHSIKVQVATMKELYNADFIDKENQAEVVRLAKTLAAYNWGRGNLSRYLTKAKNNNIDIYNSLDWINKLPIETFDYINKILLKKDPKFETQYKKAVEENEYAKLYKDLNGFNEAYQLNYIA